MSYSLNTRQAKIIFFSSLVIFIVTTVRIISTIRLMILSHTSNSTFGNTFYEMLYEMFFLIILTFIEISPALVAMFFLLKSKNPHRWYITMLFVLYALVDVVTEYVLLIRAKDPLEAGLLFIIILAPFAIILSVVSIAASVTNPTSTQKETT